jgi:hypothetical protein
MGLLVAMLSFSGVASAAPLLDASCAVPSAPPSASAVAGPNQATVTWMAANGNGSMITGYVVRATDGPNLGESVATGGAVTTAKLGSLGGGKSVVFSVAALSTCGTGAPKTTAAITPTGSATTFVTEVHADRPSVEYRLGDPSGRVMVDSSGAHRDGQYSGQETLHRPGALPADPDFSTACQSACSAIGTGTGSLPLFNSARTVEAWVNTSGASDEQPFAILSYGGSSTDQSFTVAVGADSIFVDAGSDQQRIPTPRSPSDDLWHLIDVTYDGTKLVAYLDGQPVGTALFNAPLDTVNGALNIGDAPGYPPWSGQLQEAAVYPSALSATRIVAHFGASGYSRPTAPGSPRASAGANQANIRWTAASASNASVTAYLVTAIKAGQTAGAASVKSSALSAVVTGLQGGTSYTFTIRALDAFGYGPAATTTAVTPTGSATTYASTVLGGSPSVFYRLSDSVAAVLADSSGHGQHGQYVATNVTFGVPGAIPGDPGAAVGDQGNGAGYATALGLGSIPLFNDPRTVELWLQQPATTNTAQALIAWGQVLQNNGFAVVEQTPNEIDVTGAGTDELFPLPHRLDDGSWHLITVTYDGTALAVFLDGQLAGTGQFGSQLNTLSGPLTVGSYQGGGFALRATNLDDLAVYPTALSAAQVAAHFAASGYGRPTAPTEVHAAFGGANGSQVTWGLSSAAHAPVLAYQAAVLSGPGAGVTVATAETSALLTGLAAGTDTFEVRAVDAYGYGPWSAPSTFTVTGAASTYASSVRADAPSMFYRLGDSTVALLADSSGQGQNGAYNASNVQLNIPGAIPGDAGTAVGDQGNASGYASVPEIQSIPVFNHPRTVELWIQQAVTTLTDQALVSWGQPAVGTGNAFGLIESSPSELLVAASGDDSVFPLPYRLDDGAWHQLAVTYDGSAIGAYLDGQLIGAGHFPAPLDTLGGTPLEIGTFAGVGVGLQSTALDDLAVYPSALTSARIAAHFAASGYGRPTAPGKPAATAGANRATVTWTPASAANTPITGYLVTALKAGAPAGAVGVGASTHSAVIGGLKGGTSYTFTVEAFDAYGHGPATTSAAVTPTGSAATYAATALADGPSVFYRLSDGGGPAMADSSGHSQTGVYNPGAVTFGAAGPITGDPDTAVTAARQPVGFARPSTLPEFNQPRTVEGWIKPTDAQNYPLAGWGSSTVTGEQFVVSTDGSDVFVSGGSDDLTFPTATNLADGHWHFIAVTAHASAATAYVDGASIGTQAFPTPLDTVSSDELDLGGSATGGGFSGNLADIAIFPTALSAAQIHAQFSAAAATPRGPRGSRGRSLRSALARRRRLGHARLGGPARRDAKARRR